MLITYKTNFCWKPPRYTMYHGNVLHVGELDCIRNRWAIISELYFSGIAVEQPIIRHAKVSTIELNALQVTKHCSVQNCCLDGGCTGTLDAVFSILVCLAKRILPHLQFL